MSKLKLKVGKKYVSYNGEIITIVEYDPDHECGGYYYPYKGDNERTYTSKGIFLLKKLKDIEVFMI